MDYRVEVFWKAELPDGRAEQLKSEVASLGIAHLERISLSDLYFLRGEISYSKVEFLCQHPRWTRQEGGNLGLAIFENGVQYAQKL